MRNRLKEPPIPDQKCETTRKYLIALLEEQVCSLKTISQYLRMSEKDLQNHLEHIKKTLNKGNRRLVTTPAQCKECGFIFRKRERTTKPGKCPICRSTLIQPPLLSIEGAHVAPSTS